MRKPQKCCNGSQNEETACNKMHSNHGALTRRYLLLRPLSQALVRIHTPNCIGMSCSVDQLIGSLWRVSSINRLQLHKSQMQILQTWRSWSSVDINPAVTSWYPGRCKPYHQIHTSIFGPMNSAMFSHNPAVSVFAESFAGELRLSPQGVSHQLMVATIQRFWFGGRYSIRSLKREFTSVFSRKRSF